MIDLSVVIVSYNNKKVITDCLKSIEKHNDIGDRLQVIVVEQSPEDDIYEFMKLSFPWVTTVRNENKGFGAGNNRGEHEAKGKYLLFLNPDTILIEPIFSYAVQKLDKNSRLGLFGFQLLDGERYKNSSFMMIAPYGIKNKVEYKICYKFNHFISNQMYIQGADMFIRRNVFQDIGGFDENIFMYCEESDLAIQVRKAGYELAFYSDKALIHLEGKSTKDDYSAVFEKQIKSFNYLCKKHELPFSKYILAEYRLQKINMTINKVLSKKSINNEQMLLDVIKKYL